MFQHRWTRAPRAAAQQKRVVWWGAKLLHAPTQATRRSIARTRQAHINLIMVSPTAAAVRQGCSDVLSAFCLLSVICDLAQIVLLTAAAVGCRVVALCCLDMVQHHIRSTPTLSMNIIIV